MLNVIWKHRVLSFFVLFPPDVHDEIYKHLEDTVIVKHSTPIKG